MLSRETSESVSGRKNKQVQLRLSKTLLLYVIDAYSSHMGKLDYYTHTL